MCPLAAFSLLDSPEICLTCVNTSRLDNFLMFAVCVNELIPDITLNSFSWYYLEFMCESL